MSAPERKSEQSVTSTTIAKGIIMGGIGLIAVIALIAGAVWIEPYIPR